MGKIKKSLQSINYPLFLALLLMGLLPTIYTTIRIFFLGQMPADYGLNIASQLSWVNLIYEIIQEALILPLFFLLGKVLKNTDEFKNRIRTGMLFSFVLYVLMALIIMATVELLISFMAQDNLLIKETATYIRLETVANIFIMLVKFVIIVLTTMKKEKYLYILLGAQMMLSIVFDIFFVSSLDMSLKLGVNGIAYTNIIVNCIVFIVAIFCLHKENIKVFARCKLSFKWVKEWLKVGGISGLESLVRNSAFMFMIVRMVNVVGEQGTFWVANNFIWGWLLLPILQLGELIKRDSGESGLQVIVKEKFIGYNVITCAIVLLWFASIPLWIPFLQHIMNISNYEQVFTIVLISIGFYILFAFNNIVDSIFYGIGRTDYMLYQSLVINIIFYGLMFVLYRVGIYQPSLIKIALMFAGGMALDSIFTFVMFLWILRKKKKICK